MKKPKVKLLSLIDFNRSAERAVVRASRIYHMGGVVNKLLALLYHRHNRKKYGIEIYPEITIGEGLKIPHSVGIVLGKTSVLEKNVTIYPGAKIVARYSPNRKNPDERRHARIGSGSVLGANCLVIGDVTIGDNVTIGAGAIVTKDIPSGSTVVNVNQIL